MAKDSRFPESYKDTLYAQLDSSTEKKLGLPVGLLSSVRSYGERSNHSQTNELGTATVYQFTPATRKAILDKYGLDVTLSPENASEGAGLLLQESLKRNQGNPVDAVGEYIGGTDRKNWGKTTQAYIGRVMAGHQQARFKTLDNEFARWMAANPAIPAQPASLAPAGAPQMAPGAPDPLGDAFERWIGSKTAVDRIPGHENPPPPIEAPDPTLGERLVGTGEAALTALTGATGGALGMAGGTVKGMANAILDGSFGTPEAANMVQRSAMEGAEALTYQPRTQQGQRQAQALGDALSQVIPVMPLTGELAALSRAGQAVPRAPAAVNARATVEGVARDAANAAAKPAEVAGLVTPGAAGDAAAAGAAAATQAAINGAQRVTAMSRKATTLPRRALDALRGDAEPAPTPGTMASGGAAGTDMAQQRLTTAEQLGFTGESALTKGQATRDPAQLKFEVESAKLEGPGAPLRERVIRQNEQVLRNFDNWVDKTGSEAPTVRQVGEAVDKALVARMSRDKAEIRVAYAKADKSPEALAPVDQSMAVSIGEGDTALVSTPIDYINSQPTKVPSAALVDAARQYAVSLGIADMKSGKLVPREGVTIKQMEQWRRSVGDAAGFDAPDIRNATIIKALIDGQTEPVAGQLYKQARAIRRRYAQNYEDRAAIAKLLNNKPGTADRQVAFEDVWRHSIISGSLDDVRNLRRVLQTAGDDGKQAWRELQGQTVRHIRDQAFGNAAEDAAGNRVLSPAKLDRVVRELDNDGKLDFILGKQGAQQMRDIRDLGMYIRTVPPEAAINTSNTAATLLSGFADVGLGMAVGLNAPVLTLSKVLAGHIKDAKLKARIRDALANANRRSQTPPSNVTTPGGGF